MNHARQPDANAAHGPDAAHASTQQHPIGVYLKVWLYLFVLSTLSYLVDYFDVQGIARWLLIITFMLLKAGLIVAIFMHMAWERMALVYAILVPPLALGTLVFLMWIEADYTFWTRILFLGG
jgi:cytochrome c oxidase subunit IV